MDYTGAGGKRVRGGGLISVVGQTCVFGGFDKYDLSAACFVSYDISVAGIMCSAQESGRLSRDQLQTEFHAVRNFRVSGPGGGGAGRDGGARVWVMGGLV